MSLESVAAAQAEVKKLEATVNDDLAANNTALTRYNDLLEKSNNAQKAYQAAQKERGADTSSAEYKAYQAARSASNDAKQVYQDAVSKHESDAQMLANARDDLVKVQKTADKASQETAATANSNPSNDTARASQTDSSNENGAPAASSKSSSSGSTNSGATVTGSVGANDQRFTVTKDGEDSIVTDTVRGVIVFSGPYDRAVSQAAELNRQSGSQYNQATVVSTAKAPLTQAEATKVAAANNEAPPTAANSKEISSLNQQYAAIKAQMDMPVSDSIKASKEYQNAQKQRQEQLADISKKIKTLQVGGNKAAKREDLNLPNPLDDYPTYTYGLTLFALTKEDFNSMVDSPIGFSPKKALISSAGRYREVRDKNFAEDFYFDSFKVSTVIGMNANTRGSNAITMDFSIVEPYGMTLLDRIMHISMNELAAKNYLDIPYLLRLEFFGQDDQGNYKKLTEHTKNFPIKLVSFKIKASVKGSEYAIQAVPFNHGANLESIQSLKTRMEITADTVKTFFDSTETAPKGNSTLDDTSRKEAERINNGAGGGRGTAAFAARDPRIIGATPVEETASSPLSFTAAYNAWNIAATKSNDAKVADTIKFVIDKDIANSKIADPKSTTVKRSGASDANKEAKSQEGKSAATLDTSKVVHSFEAGTTVNEVINAIIPNCEYFLKQVKDPSKDAKTQVQDGSASDATVQEQSKPLQVWKIIPSIKLSEFDTERNVWGKQVTFYVKKYESFQQRDPRLPKSPPPNAVKRYDYFYTGKNTSVINFDIDFNALYFTAAQIDRTNTETTAGAQARAPGSDADGSTKVGGKTGFGAGEKKVNTGSQMQTGVGGANNRSETQNAQSALQSIYTSAAGDMINLKLQIIGDPHFIKQDDLYIAPDMTTIQSGDSGSFVTPQVQSLNMDNGEIYCYVTFKTPGDFNDTTGMYDLTNTNPYHTSEFSGYYKVLTVDSEFRQGKFTQTLTLIRYPMQDSPNVSASKNSNALDDKRNTTATASQKATTVKPTTEKVEEKPAVPVAKTEDTTVAAKKTEAPKAAEEQKDEKLSDVAKNGETKTLDEAKPATGDAVVAPASAKIEKAQQQVTAARSEIQNIQSTNSGLADQMAALTKENAAIRAQYDALDAVANPTKEQTAQMQQYSQQITANTIKRTALYDQYKSNAAKAMDIASTANQTASSNNINGITASAGFLPARYDSLNPPTGSTIEIN